MALAIPLSNPIGISQLDAGGIISGDFGGTISTGYRFLIVNSLVQGSLHCANWGRYDLRTHTTKTSSLGCLMGGIHL